MNLNEQLKLYGFDNELFEFVNFYKRKKLPNKILISGKKGIGKYTLAYHFINFILSEEDEEMYDLDHCQININSKSYNLLKNNVHPNFYKISKLNDKKNIEISQIRELKKFINKSSFNNKLKIVLIDDVECLSNSAANSLLKLIEEPNSNVQFVLIYDNSKYLLDTIKSRCIEFKIKFKDVFIEDIVDQFYKKKIFHEIDNDFKGKYFTPKNFINLIEFCYINKIELKSLRLKNLIDFIFKNKLYINKSFQLEELKLYMEIYLLSNQRSSNDKFFLEKVYILNKKFSNLVKYNLDTETFFLEFNSNFNYE